VLDAPKADDTSVGAELLLAPLPPLLSRKSLTAPVANVTGWSKVRANDFTFDRWAEPSPIVVAISVGGMTTNGFHRADVDGARGDRSLAALVGGEARAGGVAAVVDDRTARRGQVRGRRPAVVEEGVELRVGGLRDDPGRKEL